VHAPLTRWLPPGVAVVATFVACGALHDLVTMAARGAPAFLFTPWFFVLGLGVVVGRATGVAFGGLPWAGRAAVHLLYLAGSLGLALGLRALA
jgi:hypothetical protein